MLAPGVCWVLAASLKTLNGTVVVEATHDTDATEIQALVVRGEFSLPPPPPVPFCLSLQQAHARFHVTVTTHALLRLVRWECGVGGGFGARYAAREGCDLHACLAGG